MGLEMVMVEEAPLWEPRQHFKRIELQTLGESPCPENPSRSRYSSIRCTAVLLRRVIVWW